MDDLQVTRRPSNLLPCPSAWELNIYHLCIHRHAAEKHYMNNVLHPLCVISCSYTRGLINHLHVISANANIHDMSSAWERALSQAADCGLWNFGIPISWTIV